MTDAHGWYPDPSGVHSQRYWSGDAWTPRVADAYGVIAVSHLDGDFAPPRGGPAQPVAAPARSVPALSLVTVDPAPREVVPTPVEFAPIQLPPPPPPSPPAPPAPEIEIEIEIAPVPVPAPLVVIPPPAPPAPPAPLVFEVPAARSGSRAAGWYPDPTGIHRERSWDGSAWSAVVVDRNRAVIEHAIRDSYPGPAPELLPELSASGPRHADVVTVAGLGGGGDGWQFDPTGPFRERYVINGQASDVVRIACGRVG